MTGAAKDEGRAESPAGGGAAWAKRLALASALAVAVVATGLGHVVAAARSSVAIVAENLVAPGIRDVHLVRAATPPSRVFAIALRSDAEPCADCRVRIKVWGDGRVRPVVVRPGVGSGSRLQALRDVLHGDARLELAADREWLDLGALPPAGASIEVQVIGLLPDGFSFAAIADAAHAIAIDVRPALTALVPQPFSVPPTDLLQVEVVRSAPVGAREMIDRLLVFPRASALLAAMLVAAALALVIGLERLLAGAAPAAAILLPVACVLAHAALLPPLHGADETSQYGTIEALTWKWGDDRLTAGQYPSSISRLGQALEQERVQFFAAEPLPVLDAEQRARLTSLVTGTLANEAVADGARPPDATPQPIGRAPGFFWIFSALASGLQPLSLLTRLAAYRLIAATLGIAAMGLGVWTLARCRVPRAVVLAYGAVFTIPYVVAVLATCSNYAPAIGLGGTLAAAATAAILVYPAAEARFAGALVAFAVTAGCLVWADFAFLALPMGVALAIAAVVAAVRRESSRRPAATAERRRTAVAVATLAVVLSVAAIALFQFTQGRLDDRLLRLIGSRSVATVGLMALVAAVPLAVSAAIARLDVALARRGLAWNLRCGRLWSAAVALGLLALFASTPWTTVPFERQFLTLPDFLAAYGRAIASNNFSFDQDRLTWKFWFGAFGWHDALYPAAIYAIARWTAVGFAIALPALSARFTAEEPRRSAALLVVCGVALSLVTTSLLVRHAAMIHPYGRFVLPWLPLALVPAAARLRGGLGDRFWGGALATGALFQIWTALAVLGERYYIQR